MQPLDKNTTSHSTPGKMPQIDPSILKIACASLLLGGGAFFLGRGKSLSPLRAALFNANTAKLGIAGLSVPILHAKLGQAQAPSSKEPTYTKAAGNKDVNLQKIFSLASSIPFMPIVDTPPSRPPSNLAPDIPKDHILRKEITPTIVGHEADFLIKNTALEGSLMEDNARHMQHFLHHLFAKGEISRPTTEKLEALFSQIQGNPSAENIANKVFSLSPGEPFYMQGGWRDSATHKGHALVYKFTKRADGLYDIYVYNTGVGVEKYHDGLVVEEGMQKSILTCPYVKFQGVSPSELGFSPKESHPAFFARLQAILQGKDEGSKYTTSSSILYENPDAFGRLHGKLAIAGPNTSYIKPQRAGTCALSVLFAAMKPLFVDEAEYKRFKFELKYTDFLLLFDKVKDSLQLDSTEEQLLRAQGRKLLNSLEKRVLLYSSEELATRQANIHHVLQYLSNLSTTDVTDSLKNIEPAVDDSEPSPHPQGFRSASSPADTPFAIASFSKIEKYILRTKVTPGNLLTYLTDINQDLSTDLPGYLAKVSGWYTRKNVAIYGIEKVGKALLELSEKELSSIPKDQIPRIVQEMHTALSTYLLQCANKESQEYMITMRSYLRASYLLTSLLVPNLKGYAVDYAALLRKDRYSACYSKESQDHFTKIISFFADQPAKKGRLFSLHSHLALSRDSPYPPEVNLFYTLIQPHSTETLNPEEAGALFSQQLKITEYTKVLENEYRWHYSLHTCPVSHRAVELVEMLSRSAKGALVTTLQKIAFLVQQDQGLNIKELEPRFAPYLEHCEGSEIVNVWRLPYVTEYSHLSDIPSTSKDHFTEALENEQLLQMQYWPKDGIPRISTNEKTLQSSKLLYFFSENLTKLSDKETGQVFFRLLFQPNKDVREDPPLFVALKDPTFVRQLCTFVDKGMQFFSTGVFSAKPDIIASLVFIRLIRRIKEIDSTLELPNLHAKINEYLRLPDLTEEERNLLHLHRILQYRNQQPSTLHKKELLEIFTSWMFCATSTFSHTADGVHQKEEAFRFLLSLEPLVQSLSSSDYDHILYHTIGKTQKDLKTLISKTWNMNVITGEMTLSGTPVLFEKSKYLPDLSEHKEVFGMANFPQVRQGNMLSFTDSKTGLSFRYLHPETDCFLQINVEGSWYQKVPWHEKKRALDFTKLPSLLQTYHLFSRGSSVLFLHKDTRTVDFLINKEGYLINKKNGSLVSDMVDVHMPELDAFEHPSMRLHEKDKAGRKKILFPRLCTATGNTLCLQQNSSGTFALEENPGFILVKPIPGILGSLRSILCFQHVDTEEIKVLVPMRKDISPRNLSPTQALSLENEEKQIETIYPYAEYSCDGVSILANNLESKLFRSYLLQVQKQEEESLALLESIGEERPLTQTMYDILRWMEQSSNHTPSGIAIALRASMLLREHHQDSQLESVFADYRNRYTSIPAHLRLSPFEQKRIRQLCPSEAFTLNGSKKKTPLPSDYRLFTQAITDSGQISPNQRYPDTQRGWRVEFSKDVLDAYDTLLRASTEEEKNTIFAKIAIQPLETRAQALLIAARNYTSGTPPKPYWKAASNAWLYDLGGCLIPPSTGAVDTDKPLPKGASLRSLQDALEEVHVPSITKGPFPSRKVAPVISLESELVTPFFHKFTPAHKPPTPHLRLPDLSHPLYKKPLTRAIKEVNKEITLGSTMNAQEVSFALRPSMSSKTVKTQITAKLGELKTFLCSAKEDILSIARQLPSDPMLAQKTSRLELGGYKKTAEFEEVITHYLTGDYTGLNPHLTKEQLADLDQRVEDFLVQATKAQQLETALGQTDPHMMASALTATMSYAPSQNREERAFLVYEYRSGLRIRPAQEQAIRTMLSQKSLVLQMMMGAGKTTVLTSIFLQLIPKGNIPIYVPPDAQFDTQVHNLTNMQHKHFYKHVIPMRFSEEELTVERLQWILDKFEEAATHGKAIIATKNTLSGLQLMAYRLSHRDPYTLSLLEQKKIPLLQKICIELEAHGVAILDEADKLLTPFEMLNFPVGEKKSLDPEYVDFIQDVFSLHLDPHIEGLLGLTKGEQSLFSREKYEQNICPLIGRKIVEKYKRVFGVEGPLEQDCLDYIVKGASSSAFMDFLAARAKNKDPIIATSAQLIYLAKGLVKDLLPAIMEKQENRNFGIPEDATEHKVIPFEGAKSPSPTEFADPYQTACLHNISALSHVLLPHELQKVAKDFLDKSIPLAQYTGQKLEDTLEGKEFFRLTGVPLARFSRKDPKALEEAMAFLQSHPEQRLEIEKIFIREFVGAYEQFFQSNSQNFLSLFSRTIGITGTPKNPMLFPEDMPVYAEEGTLGRIRSTYLDRTDAGQSLIHTHKTDAVADVLASALKNNPRKEKFRALLDPIGLFRNETNYSVAESILTYFAKDPRIQGVLFYGKTSGNRTTAGTLMLLKKKSDGTFACETLEATDEQSLKSRGIDPNTTITFYDEKHCEATHLAQIQDALGVMTASSSLEDRDSAQTWLRFRKYLQTQDIDLAVLEKELQNNYPKNCTGRDMLTQMVIAQEIHNANDVYIIFRQKMENIFRKKANDLYLKNPTHSTMHRLKDILLCKLDITPQALFGGTYHLEDPLQLFLSRRKELEKDFSFLMDATLKKQLDALEAEFVKNMDRLPSLVSTSKATPSGMQMQLSLQQEVKQENLVDNTLQLELRTEYQNYNQQSQDNVFREIPWKTSNVRITPKSRTPDAPQIMSLENLLYKVSYKKKYYKLFTESSIHVTENFAYTRSGGLLPIFSKKQKPAEQILVIEEKNTLKALLLSEEEAKVFKERIAQGMQSAWLYLPDGQMHVTPKGKQEPSDTAALRKILFDVNLLNGNAGYMLRYQEETLSRVKNNPELQDLFLRFLGVHAERFPQQQAAVNRLSLQLRGKKIY